VKSVARKNICPTIGEATNNRQRQQLVNLNKLLEKLFKLELKCDRLWQKQPEVTNDKTAEISLTLWTRETGMPV